MYQFLRSKISHIAAALFLILLSSSAFPQQIERQVKADLSSRNHFGVFKYRSKSDDQKPRSEFRDYSRNYFHLDADENSLWNGRHWDRKDYPLRVYIKKTQLKDFRPVFYNYINYAMEVWEKADKRIKFRIVSSEDSANVTISFVNNLEPEYEENFLGVTKTDFSKENNYEITKAAVQLGLLKFNNKRVADGEMKAAIVNEIGHVLGLGHSEDDKDIMYPYIDPLWDNDMDFNELSSGDYLAIHSLTNLGFKNYKDSLGSSVTVKKGKP